VTPDKNYLPPNKGEEQLARSGHIKIFADDPDKYLVTSFGEDEIVVTERKARRYAVMRTIYHESNGSPQKPVPAALIAKTHNLSDSIVFSEFQTLEALGYIKRFMASTQALITGPGIEFFERNDNPFAVTVHGELRINSHNYKTEGDNSPVQANSISSSQTVSGTSTPPTMEG
jgi:hypothetical protein